MYPLVSIITINYNQYDVTCALLDTLQVITYPAVEVIVVDNGSAQDEAARLAAAYSFARVLAASDNLGFTGGNNLGMQAAKGDFILLLNNDTEVPAGFLEPLVRHMQQDAAIGICSPKIRYHHTDNILQYAGSHAINRFTARGRKIGWGEHDAGQHDVSGPTHLPHGAAMLIRRSVIDTIGMLGDVFFIYYEEHDFAERAKRAGYEIHFVAESWISHKESVTVGKDNAFKTYYMTRNRLLFTRRNVFGVAKLLAIVYVLLCAVPKHSLHYLVRQRWDLLDALWRGMLWHFNRQPEVHTNPRLQTA